MRLRLVAGANALQRVAWHASVVVCVRSVPVQRVNDRRRLKFGNSLNLLLPKPFVHESYM
jgi:hypothetical protein